MTFQSGSAVLGHTTRRSARLQTFRAATTPSSAWVPLCIRLSHAPVFSSCSVLRRSSRPSLSDLHESREGMEAGDVPEIRMRWLLLVPSAAVELPSLTSNREPSLLSSPSMAWCKPESRRASGAATRHKGQRKACLSSRGTDHCLPPSLYPNKHHSTDRSDSSAQESLASTYSVAFLTDGV